VTLATAAVIGLLTVLAASTVVWAVSLGRRDASIADIAWGPGFALVAWTYVLLLGAVHPRSLVAAALITLWALRLALHIGWRHRGEDPRYRAMRARHGDAFWWRSLFVVFWLQAVILWFVALPILAIAGLPSPAQIRSTDAAGLVLFTIGFAFEAIGDYQLTRFRSDPSNRGRVLDTGLWGYTRHPNYFGDALLWWGVYLVACSTTRGWMTVASPLLMTVLLLKVSGVTLLESSLKTSKPDYADYIERTPAFVPWFPRRRRRSASR
jgi:steroid 5-alpha reductase family enzyme